jgi:hypothetical protein
MEPYMWHTLWLIVGFYGGIVVALLVTSFARAVGDGDGRTLRMEEPGAVVERLDAGKEWSVRVMH